MGKQGFSNLTLWLSYSYIANIVIFAYIHIRLTFTDMKDHVITSLVQADRLNQLQQCVFDTLDVSGQLQFYKSLYIITIPTFSHINSDVQSAKFNKNSDECHARTYIYSDEKRKTAHHNLTINPSSILLGRHILHLPYDMHIVQRLKS